MLNNQLIKANKAAFYYTPFIYGFLIFKIKWKTYYLIILIFLSSSAQSIEIEHIDIGDKFFIAMDLNDKERIIVSIVAVKDNLVEVLYESGETEWVSPDRLVSRSPLDETTMAVGGSLLHLMFQITEEAIDNTIENMTIANIAFTVPKTLNIKDTGKIRLLLSHQETIEKLKNHLSKVGENIFSESIRVSNRMEARLTGTNFKVISISPEIQAIPENENTEWIWTIHPEREGKHAVYLTLTAFIDVRGENTPRMIETFEKYITVQITNTQLAYNIFNTHWQWAWTALLIPITGWAWRIRANKSNL